MAQMIKKGITSPINELYEKLNLKEGLKGLEKLLNKRKLNAEGGSQKEPGS